jgi:hypothetical protein
MKLKFFQVMPLALAGIVRGRLAPPLFVMVTLLALEESLFCRLVELEVVSPMMVTAAVATARVSVYVPARTVTVGMEFACAYEMAEPMAV